MMYVKTEAGKIVVENGKPVFAKKLVDAQGEHDANADNPTIPAGWELIDSISITDELDVNGFATLTLKQLRMALWIEWKVKWSDVKSIIDSMPDNDDKELALIELETSLIFHRNHSLISLCAKALNKTGSEVDAVWIKYQST